MPDEIDDELRTDIKKAVEALYRKSRGNNWTLDEVRSKLAAVQRLVQERTPIARFFQSVGSGVVNAQRDLDAQSHGYNLDSPVPSLFRIPKVNAEIHFAISDVEEQQLNAIVYGSRRSEEERMEHQVSFEIVAAPPPTDGDRLARHWLLGYRLVVDEENRKEALESLKKAQDDAHQAKKEAMEGMVDTFSQVLVFTPVQAKKGEAADGDSSEPFRIFVLARRPGRGESGADLQIVATGAGQDLSVSKLRWNSGAKKVVGEWLADVCERHGKYV